MPIQRLLEIVAALRGEKGCPWDREQTLESIKQYLVEECCELVEAIDSGDVDRHREELGDTLLQVALQTQMRHEQGAFSFDDVVETLCAKLIRRHPHVFGNTKVSGSAEVLKNWESIKASEKRGAAGKKCCVLPRSSVENVPARMPALRKAHQVQSRASRFGFGREEPGKAVAEAENAFAQLKGILAGSRDGKLLKEKMGDLLFALVRFGRISGVNAEDALNASVEKFIRRFADAQEKRKKNASARRHAPASAEEKPLAKSRRSSSRR